MYMNATILDAQMNPYFTGIDVNLYDQDEKQTYKAQIVGGLPGLEDLLHLKKQNKSEAELQEAASQVAFPPVMQPVYLRVRRVKVNKAGFMNLVCHYGIDQ